ncbi:MAG: hypothetical protein DRJ50_13125 [Actinobacteria bacterium]|nr:MAG: hypothetical protein DRJ50_13125 [Actinomycetota bacterium]
MACMLVVGHRGASSAAVENSRAAFELAEQMGADGVELDVRITLDEKLLVHHDPLPDNPDDRAGLLTLDEALDSMTDRMLVNVEIKNGVFDGGFDPQMTVVELTLETLQRRGGGTGQWLISSFSWASIQASRSLAPEIRTAYLCKGLSARGARRISAAGHSAAHPHVSSVNAELVENCHSLGLAVNTWTCNDPERIVELADLGVDGVCTDVPDVALSALGRKSDRLGVSPRWAQWRERPA